MENLIQNTLQFTTFFTHHLLLLNFNSPRSEFYKSFQGQYWKQKKFEMYGEWIYFYIIL